MTKTEEKAFLEEVESRSIVETQQASAFRSPVSPIVLNIAMIADEIIPWGVDVKSRDLQLRSFWPTESLLSSAVNIMTSKVFTLDWEVIGSDPYKPKPKNTILAAEKLLKYADRGKGWQTFVTKVLIDLYTVDNGAFIEIIRRDNDPRSPVIGIAHLDSQRCYRTGDPEIPVFYEDDNGQYHKMYWYQVVTLEDMPSPVVTMYNVQYCAVTRCLRSAQLIRDTSIYKKEKLSGQNPRAIHLVSGMTQAELDDARAWAERQAQNQNTYRYISPYILATVNPEGNLEHKQIDLATLPDGYNEDTTFKWYITLVAMAFGADYQEFAPLPSGAMGSGSQSEILHLKSRGKGSAVAAKLIQDLINDNNIIPSTVKFQFKSGDASANKDASEARFTRGKDRSLRLDAGELSQEASIALAVLDGDLPEHIAFELIRNLPEREPKAPDPLTPDQITGGSDSGNTKGIDTARSELIRELQNSEDLIMADQEVEITQEDLDAIYTDLVKRRAAVFNSAIKKQ